MSGPLRDWSEYRLAEESPRHNGLVDPSPIRKASAENLSDRQDCSHRLRIILMLME